jgi:hypothetical protein
VIFRMTAQYNATSELEDLKNQEETWCLWEEGWCGFWHALRMTRVFSAESIWNQPISPELKKHARSDEWMTLLAREPNGAFGINSRLYTTPVYHARRDTRLRRIFQRPAPPRRFETTMDGFLDTRREITFSHGPGFGWVPVPEEALQDQGTDGHLAIVDTSRNLIHDMWGAHRREDGEWESYTGMTYAIDGSGVFDRAQHLPRIENGDSVHQHGPSRASGTPAIAGIVFREEVLAGTIEHKLAFGCRFNAFQEFVWPAIWTDGQWPQGLPEGCLLQLDPSLDLAPFELPRGELAIARALQKYGAINVDLAGANTIPVERRIDGQPDSWEGLISKHGDFLRRIPLSCYRILDTGEATQEGDRESHLWLYKPLGVEDHPLRSATGWH